MFWSSWSSSGVYLYKKIKVHGKNIILRHLTNDINLLKPSGNFTFNIQKFYVVPTLRLCVLYGSQNKQQLLPYKTLRDWFL
jgi:hypothetical protein